MSSTATNNNDNAGYKFDPSETEDLKAEFYVSSEEDKQFFKEYVGFKDDDELKAHAFEVRRKAYAVSKNLGMIPKLDRYQMALNRSFHTLVFVYLILPGRGAQAWKCSATK